MGIVTKYLTEIDLSMVNIFVPLPCSLTQQKTYGDSIINLVWSLAPGDLHENKYLLSALRPLMSVLYFDNFN